ncbi:MAG: PAS domain-containing protein [Anaerolineaceae bacterium]|nr:PAS domain-containing protein [Anaerolineaceae bacterium]MCB9099046.1 PAS domain-containing protein [Anaerolineales bacterium]
MKTLSVDQKSMIMPHHNIEARLASLYANGQDQFDDALIESEKRYSQLLESVTDYIYRVRFENGVPVETRHGPNCVAVTGYTSEEYEANPELWYQMIHEADRRSVLKQIIKLRLGEFASPIEHRIIHKDGSIRWVRNSTVLRKDEAGQVISYDGLITDITARKHTEEALREREEQLQLAIVGSRGGIWMIRFEPDNPSRPIPDEIYISPQMKQFIGFDDDEFPNSIEAWQNRILPEDLELLHRSGRDHLSGRSEIYEQEYRIRHRDGSLRWLYTRGRLQLDEESRPCQWVGIVWDITERKRLQERLEAIYQLGQELALLRDEAAIAAQVLSTAASTLQVDSASYGLMDEITGKLRYCYYLSDGELQTIELYLPLVDRTLSDIGVAVLQEGRVINVADTRNDNRYVSKLSKWAGRSELAVPMKIGERVIGVLHATSAEPRHFSAEDEQLLQTLADQTAVAIENARLYEEIQRRVQELTLLNEQTEMLRQAAAALTSSLNLDQVLETILTYLEQVVPYDSACVFLWEDEGLRAVAARGFATQEQVIGEHYSTELPAYQEIKNNNHALMLTSVMHGLCDIDSIPGWLGIPLMLRGKIIGYLTLDNQQTAIYDQSQRSFAQAFANQAAAAIQNARLYESEREQYRRLQQSHAQLIQVEKMAALGRLVASVAHEVNNPLQATQNALMLLEIELEGRQRPDKVAYHLNITRTEIDRISSIVHRMREFYSPLRLKRSNQLVNGDAIDDFYRSTDDELQPIDLHVILESVLQLTNKQLQHHHITIAQTWSKDIPLLHGNSDQLKQVCLNLILNAIDAMSGQAGTLHIRTAPVHAHLHENRLQPAVRLEFSDTGPGMPPEILSRLFEPFFTTKEQGSGLGLFVCYKIIEAHHGRLHVESHVGLGTTFTILLPVVQP